MSLSQENSHNAQKSKFRESSNEDFASIVLHILFLERITESEQQGKRLRIPATPAINGCGLGIKRNNPLQAYNSSASRQSVYKKPEKEISIFCIFGIKKNSLCLFL